MSETPSNFNDFDEAAAGKALGSDPRPTWDVAHGEGDAIVVGDTTLEVYPDAGVTRVTTLDARIELFRVPSYSITGERVVLEQGTDDDRSRLLVRPDGKVSFYPVLRATESSRTQETASNGRQDSLTSETASESPTGRNSSTEGEKNGEVEQVQLQGRLGRDPWFGKAEDTPIAHFPLAVNDERGQTTWHKVVVFDDTARDLYEAVNKKQIAKGRLVDVTGQMVVREEPKANGGVKKSPEFHATPVVRVQSRPRP